MTPTSQKRTAFQDSVTSSRHALVQAAHQDVEIDSNLADAFAVAREPDEQAMPQEARLCDDASSLPWRPMLRELRFDGAATTSDQSHHSDGWTDTSVVASGGAAAMVPAIAMPQFKNEIAETRTSEHSTLARVERARRSVVDPAKIESTSKART